MVFTVNFEGQSDKQILNRMNEIFLNACQDINKGTTPDDMKNLNSLELENNE